MTRAETAKILAVLAASYPKFEVDDLKLQVWHEMLGDLDYRIVGMAVKKLILESTFPPAIAEVRGAAIEIQSPRGNTGSDAWGEVVQAIRRYGYYRAEEALANMSPETARIVRSIGWQEICLNEEPGVVRGQFLKMYQQVAEREQKEKLLPADLREDIQRIAGRMDMKVITGGRSVEGGY
jgi:hypothetical protein